MSSSDPLYEPPADFEAYKRQKGGWRQFLIYCLPFSYAFKTRYLEHLEMVVVFEWLPSVLLGGFFGKFELSKSLFLAVLNYFAFVCLYEIGYIVNDYVSVRWETVPKKRGPSGVSDWMLSLWIGVRLIVFYVLSTVLVPLLGKAWLGFFLFLAVVFALHNSFRIKALKVCSFIWLAICRFCAPTLLLLEPSRISEVVTVAAVLYAGFRSFGYMESKGILNMPWRRTSYFRISFFALPLPFAAILFFQVGLGPFSLLAPYFFFAATVDAFRLEGVPNLKPSAEESQNRPS